jgi:hypothetical protein
MLLGGPGCTWTDSIEVYFQETECKNLNWIKLVQDRSQWRFLVNVIMKSGVYKRRGISSAAERPSASE